MEDSADRGVWVFGYGSLCWHPGFEYDLCVTGYVTGYARRFWQGNTTHRGTEDKPGRVATLVEEKEGSVWGRAYLVRGAAALPYLDQRECQLGGYRTELAVCHSVPSRPPFPALLYLATPANPLWLGDAPLPEIAGQILSCHGPSGYNAEYLLRLADFMREQAPDVPDEHLFTLETLVRARIKEQNLCLKTLMGEPTARARLPDEPAGDEAEGAVGGAAVAVEPAPRPDSFEFTSRVPPKKLRCLNI